MSFAFTQRLLVWVMLVSSLALSSAAALGHSMPGEGTSTSNRRLAETLFREARSLMAEERYNEACPKLAESHRLDPASGTLLGLAMCHEAQGKIAAAWAEFQEVLAAARRDGRADRAEFASERIAALEPRLTRVTILASTGVEGLVVKLDGVALGPAAFGVATPIDPGPHTIVATAPDSRPWVRRFAVDEGGGADQRVEVPPLEPLPEGEPATPGAAAPEPALASRPRPALPLSVKIAGGATIALSAAAIGTGIVTLSKASEFDDANEDPDKTFEEREELRDSANTWGTVNTVLMAGTLVGAAVTAYFYLTREKAPEAVQAPPLRLWVTGKAAGIGWTGEL